MSNGVNFRKMAVDLREQLTTAFAVQAALREELQHSECMRQIYKIDAKVYKDALTAAEQRNAELIELLQECPLELHTGAMFAMGICKCSGCDFLRKIAALKPTESGASE